MHDLETMATYEQLMEVAKVLTSDRFYQIHGALRKSLNNDIIQKDEFGYCCLGVAKEVCKLNEVQWNFSDGSSVSYLQYEFENEVGDVVTQFIFLPLYVQKFLAQLNDNGFSFNKISIVFENLARDLQLNKDWETINEQYRSAFNILTAPSEF